MKIFRNAALAASMLLAAMSAIAQPISVDEFAKHSLVSEVSISPTGEYLAVIAPTADGRESLLRVMKMDGSKIQGIRLGRDQYVTDVLWSDDTRLVISKARKLFGEERPRATGELLSVDVDGKNQEMLFGYVPDDGNTRGRRKDEGFAEVLRVLDKEPGYVLIGFTGWGEFDRDVSTIYRVNTRTGERRQVERVNRAADWAFDRTGKLRVLVSLDAHDVPQMLYRQSATSELLPMPKSLVGYRSYGGWFSADGNIAHLYISDRGEPAQLFRVDLAKGTREKLAGDPDQEVAYALLGGYDGVPFAVGYDAGKPTLSYVGEANDWANLHGGLMKHFAGQIVRFSSFTRDNSSVMFSVSSDRNPGAFYQYDLRNKKLRLVIEAMPWLKAEKLAPVMPVEFKAKDGTRLFAFYTASGTSPRPLVVMPHGGPFDVHDTWGYDADAQFLASRGYGVLQVNFRGSGGRGQNFEETGWKHWGDLLQDDLADGVRWATGSGYADASRVCLYGASFGGYSALMNPIRNPGMYKCAIGYVGVYDLNMMVQDRSVTSNKATKRFFDRTLGTDRELLSLTSPALHAAKLDVPVMLVHGKLDETAQLDQFKAMQAALKKAGKPFEVMLVDGEGHGFYNPENVAELYRRMEAFLGKHIGPGVVTPAGGAGK